MFDNLPMPIGIFLIGFLLWALLFGGFWIFALWTWVTQFGWKEGWKQYRNACREAEVFTTNWRKNRPF